MNKIEITVVNTLNGKKGQIQAESNMTYGEVIKMYALAPPDVAWTVLDEDGNDIIDLTVEERECRAHIVPGKDIAGG